MMGRAKTGAKNHASTTSKPLIRQLDALISTELSRSVLSQGLGLTYSGERDVYATLGYKKTIRYEDYDRKFIRDGIAKRIICAFPDATWRGVSYVYEDEDQEVHTKFEKAWNGLLTRIRVFSFLQRVDRLAGVGQYAVLFMGFDDGGGLESEVTRASTLLFLQPYSQNNATIDTLDKDVKSPRYGLPVLYRLKMSSSEASGSTEVKVHHSRIIHVAEGLTESNVYGTPRLEPVFNYLENIEKIVGGSAEMFWRGASKDLALEMDPAAVVEDEDALNDEITDYMHNLRRVLRLKGIKAKSLAPAAVDPESHVDVQLKMISGATGIPIRLLTGSERGEQASTQDRENWNDRVRERCTQFAEPEILRKLVDRLVAVGVLPKLGADGYKVSWPDIEMTSEKEKAEIGDLRSRAMKAYVESGASAIVGPLQFLTAFLGFDDETAAAMVDEVEGMLMAEDKEGGEDETEETE